MSDPLIRRLRELAPFDDDRAAMRALEATVSALWQRLFPEERERLAAELPLPVSERMRAPNPRPPRTAAKESFTAEVARKEDVRPALGTEHAEIVCRALSECLSPDVRSWLQQRLPELAPLFDLPEPREPPLSAGPPELDAPHDLAQGRPGSSHPLSTASPERLAHRHSVARSDDPHADSKLSSASGLTQEREGRTLSRGKPGSRRPLSGPR